MQTTGRANGSITPTSPLVVIEPSFSLDSGKPQD